jgi:hypothetical protein
VEGLFVVCRQGSQGDTGGILVDVAAYGITTHVLEAIETQFTHQDGSGTVLAQLNTQVALAKPGAESGGRWVGFEAVALTGTKFDGTEETYGYLVTNLDGTTTWRAAFCSLGKSTYGLDLSQATISFASLATPNNVPIKQGDSGGTLRNILNVDGSDGLQIGAPELTVVLNGADIRWGKALVALGGGAAPTLGTIGGSGPATAGQNSWMRVLDSTGTPFWVPVWK